MMKLIIVIEKEFDISISIDEVVQINDFSNLLELVQQKIKE